MPGIFDSIKGKVTGSEAVDAMCTYLKGIGVNSCALPKDSPEAIPVEKFLGATLGNPPIGTIKLEGKNIDLIELSRKQEKKSSTSFGVGGIGIGVESSDEDNVREKYIIRTDTGLGKDLKAELKPIEKGLMNKELVGYEWKGGKLAKALEADTELTKMIMDSFTKAQIVVDFNQKYSYVSMIGENVRKHKKEVFFNLGGFDAIGAIKATSKVAHGEDPLEIWKNVFPTTEELVVYDRIAGDIKTLTKKP